MFKHLSKLSLSRSRAATMASNAGTLRTFATKAASSSAAKHTPDSYNKDDIDTTPPPDSSIFRVDAATDSVQKPHEHPSGKWSKAGVRTSEYEHSDNAYKTEGGPGLRYGGKEEFSKEKGPETSGGNEGPEKGSRGGGGSLC